MGVRSKIFSRTSPAEANSSSEEKNDGYEKSPVNSEIDDGALRAVHAVHPGELSFEEDVAGGLGRHLGLVSTTFLM